MRAETVVNARRRQRRGWVGNEVAREVSCGGESEGEKKTCRRAGYPCDFAGNKFIRDRLIYRPQV